MLIREYLRERVFRPRAEEHRCLVVYDPERRYREIVLSLASDKTQIIDVSDSVIEQREAANVALNELALGHIHQLILWVPVEAPQDEDDKQRDLFSVFAEVGTHFPDGDGDEFTEICRRAKSDHVSEINLMFEEGIPSFEMIDALEEGGSWPKLKTLLGVNSPLEILIAFLSPTAFQEESLKSDKTWASEAKEFSSRALGHRLKTKGETRKSVADEWWTLVLFSEFIFDSQGEAPNSLSSVPRAGGEARTLVYEVCEQLRKHDDHKDLYKTTAQKVEDDLQLAERAAGVSNLGIRDTFSFEERVFLKRFVEAASAGDIEGARVIRETRKNSIWLSQEDRLAEWILADRALNLLDATARLSAPSFSSLEEIIHGYASHWRELDRNHREMEQSVNQIEGDHKDLDTLVVAARKAYFQSVEALQKEFLRHVESEGWPATGSHILWNRQLFDKVVSPRLDEGKRVAYFLVDSLRYELGAELEKQLSEKMKVSLFAVCAQLPSYTEVGMASLMPEAEANLSVEEKNGKLVTHLGGKTATDPTTRRAYLESKKGDQCDDIELTTLVKKKRISINDGVRLLVVRTRDIDSIAHKSPHHVLDIIPGLVREVIRGISRVGELGFDEAVIATDHGFLLFSDQIAGNDVKPPPGNWLVKKSRCLLGTGESDSDNLVMPADQLGIPGDMKHYAVPRNLIPYSGKDLYYHEGLSLQECVLPCLTVELPTPERGKKASGIRLMLSYRQGKSDRISMRRPVIDLAWPEADLFAEESEKEVVVEAIDAKEKIVGTAASGQTVNPATGGVRIQPGAAISVGLAMNDDFSGKFTVRVLDANTNVTLAELPLKTAYLE
tara:strand:+ start:2658 stop:5174 length:2517 start_codon:yes stop_codon:yes gene_type:complete